MKALGNWVTASLALLAGVLSPVSAVAEEKLIIIPAEEFAIAPGGVDLRTGRYVYNETDLSVGGEGGLSLTRTMPNYSGNHANPFGNFSHNWDIMLLESRRSFFTGYPVGGDYRMSVYFGGRALTFDSPQNAVGYGYNGNGPSAYLTFTGTKSSSTAIFSLRSPDGTIMKFRPIGNLDCANQNWGSAPRRCAFISEMVQPDGTKFTFDYAYNSAAAGNRARLKSVISSRGYALIFEGTGSQVTAACLLNLSQTVLPTGGLCPAGVPKASYTYSGTSLTSATTPDGATSSFTYGTVGSQKVMRFIKPGQSTPWLVNTITMRMDEEDILQETIDRQTFSTGESYTYGWGFTPFTNNKPIPTIVGGGYSDAVGGGGAAVYDFPVLPGTEVGAPCTQLPCSEPMPDDEYNSTYQTTPGPVEVTDPQGRTTTYDYCDPIPMAQLPPQNTARCFVVPLRSFTDADGVKTFLKYGVSSNIIEVRRQAKPGSGLADIVTSATYDCTYPVSCTKPTSMTDAKGFVTNYSYDPAHGGLLSEMKPAAVTGGPRPLTRRTYVQKYAYIKNSSGALVAAATAVWLPATETKCQTVAGSSSPVCDSGAPQMVTTYEYGANGTANNLLARGVVVTGGGSTLRTCYGYDAFGRRISETLPNASLTSCS